MRRTMNFETLQGYISNAHTNLMLCLAHADNFKLNSQEIEDSAQLIDLQLDGLLRLKDNLVTRHVEIEQLKADAITHHRMMEARRKARVEDFHSPDPGRA